MVTFSFNSQAVMHEISVTASVRRPSLEIFEHTAACIRSTYDAYSSLGVAEIKPKGPTPNGFPSLLARASSCCANRRTNQPTVRRLYRLSRLANSHGTSGFSCRDRSRNHESDQGESTNSSWGRVRSCVFFARYHSK